MTDESAVVPLSIMMAKKADLIEEIYQQKKDINNIQLQLDRSDSNPSDEENRRWRARAQYARNMKEADLEKMESLLEIVNKALDEPQGAPDQNSMVALEFVSAAKRRLDPTVFISIMDEANEIVQDAMYDTIAQVNYTSEQVRF